MSDKLLSKLSANTPNFITFCEDEKRQWLPACDQEHLELLAFFEEAIARLKSRYTYGPNWKETLWLAYQAGCGDIDNKIDEEEAKDKFEKWFDHIGYPTESR